MNKSLQPLSKIPRAVPRKIGYKPQFTILDILLDGVEWFLGGDFHLGVAPPWDLDNHVEVFSISEGKIKSAILVQ